MEARILVPLLAEERLRYVRIARRRLPTLADAEDVVQGAMARAADRAGSLVDPARARPWFSQILRRSIADFYRSRGLERPTASGEIEIADDAEPLHHPCACGLRLLDGLRPAYADVLRRVDVEGSRPEEAAVALGISTANLHVRLHRARRALRERLESHCGVSSCGPCLDCSCDAEHRCGSDRSEAP